MKRVLCYCLMALNVIFFPILLFYPVFLLKVLPIPPWQRLCERALFWISFQWTLWNTRILKLFAGYEVRVEVDPGIELRRDARYLLLSNHQTFADIFVLQTIFHPKTPFLTFFIKRELLWMPVFGPIWWALGFPFMRRHSPEYLAKHPEKRGTDLETTRKFCQRIRGKPYSIVNFVEGTRKTPSKLKKSPYKNLIPPKAGGMATALQSLEYEFDQILDVTIRYTSKRIGFWDLLSGHVGTVYARVSSIPIESVPRGDYFTDSVFAESFRSWLNGVWAEKDRRFEAIQENAA